MEFLYKLLSMRKLAVIVLIVGSLASIGLQIYQESSRAPLPEKLVGIVLPEARPLSPFTLKDHHGVDFNLDRFRGRWTFLFFGYTHCPDICPTSMVELASVFDGLKDHKEILANTGAVFVSVDPARDSLESLKEFVPYFHEDFLGVTGTKEQINDFSRQVGAAYFVPDEEKNQEDYAVSHTSSFFLINPEGAFYALFQPPRHTPEMILHAYLTIRQLNAAN